MAKTLKTIFFISYVTLLSSLSICECDPLANASTTKGFTTDLIHRVTETPPIPPSPILPCRLGGASPRPSNGH
ncbi:aspartic proteinase CDR1-like [Salvia divinorum]|uniref:Aspartic proteinase CDR1-like n=1 Tax=Salvia divinorum TaxID=28513 RepID=A0ABD1FY12_SALDI